MANTCKGSLYDLGIFSQVDMAIQNPDGDEDNKYVVYNLDEARRYSITTGFGLQIRAHRRIERGYGPVGPRWRAGG